MPEELIMRGQTASGDEEVLNFGGRTPGYGYQLVDFVLYASTAIGTDVAELAGTVTADKTGMNAVTPNFNSPGLIGTFAASWGVIQTTGTETIPGGYGVVNDLFVITQDLILQVIDTNSNPINWQLKFRKVKLSGAAEAAANFKQFTIFDD